MRVQILTSRLARRTTGARDVVDLLLVRAAFYGVGTNLASLRAACTDPFASRAAEAELLGHEPREWPPLVVAHEHWLVDFEAARRAVDLEVGLVDAVAALNAWIDEVDAAGES